MPEVNSFSAQGAAGQPVMLRDDVFGGEPNEALLHQAVLRQQADRRQGTHDTQTRAEVSRTTKKVWRQKGTGRARQGSRKGPHWSGGGVAFGPHPRSYRQDMPRKMRAAAIRSALAAKTASGDLVIIEDLSIETPSTKHIRQLLLSIGGGAQVKSTLLMTEGPQRGVHLSARNLQDVTTATIENVNVYDLLRHRRVILTLSAARQLESRYGAAEPSMTTETEGAAAESPARKRASKSAAKSARSSASTADAAKE